MTTTIKITSELLACLDSPTGLVIEAVKSGNFNLLRVLLDQKIVFKQYAHDTLNELDRVEVLLKGIKRFLRLDEVVLEAITAAEEKAHQKKVPVDLQKLKSQICALLQAEKKQMIIEFRLKYRHLSEDDYLQKKQTFEQTISEEFAMYPWEGFSHQKHLQRYKKRLMTNIQSLKAQQASLKPQKKVIRIALTELQWEVSDKRFEWAESFRTALRAFKVELPLMSFLLGANVQQLKGYYEEGEYNLLHLSIEGGHTAIRDFLLICGMDAQTELDIAIQKRRVAVVKELVALNLPTVCLLRERLNEKDHHGETFLHHAMRHALIMSDYSFVIALIKKGAYLFERSEEEVTPWDIANGFEPLTKAAKLKHTAFLYDMAYAMLIERQYHASQTFSPYQNALLELFQTQHQFIQQDLKKLLAPALRQLAEKQLEIIDDLLFILAQSHGKLDDNPIHQAIIDVQQKSPVSLDYGDFGAKLAKLHTMAFRLPGYAFNVIEALIKDDESRLEAYAHNARFFSERMQAASAAASQHSYRS